MPPLSTRGEADPIAKSPFQWLRNCRKGLLDAEHPPDDSRREFASPSCGTEHQLSRRARAEVSFGVRRRRSGARQWRSCMINGFLSVGEMHLGPDATDDDTAGRELGSCGNSKLARSLSGKATTDVQRYRG